MDAIGSKKEDKKQHYGKVSHFLGSQVEKQPKSQGLLYGSENVSSDIPPLDSEEREYYTPFGRPGAGAPLKSRDGSVLTSLRSDPETRFQTHLQKEVENSLRYRDAEAVKEGLTSSSKTQSDEMAHGLQQMSLDDQDKGAVKKGQEKKEKEKEKDKDSGDEKEKEKAQSPPTFPWSSSEGHPQLDESGKLRKRKIIKEQQPKPEYESIAEQMQRMGKKKADSYNTHPLSQGLGLQWDKPGVEENCPLTDKYEKKESGEDKNKTEEEKKKKKDAEKKEKSKYEGEKKEKSKYEGEKSKYMYEAEKSKYEGEKKKDGKSKEQTGAESDLQTSALQSEAAGKLAGQLYFEPSEEKIQQQRSGCEKRNSHHTLWEGGYEYQPSQKN